jgi:hypothetical protein
VFSFLFQIIGTISNASYSKQWCVKQYLSAFKLFSVFPNTDRLFVTNMISTSVLFFNNTSYMLFAFKLFSVFRSIKVKIVFGK